MDYLMAPRRCDRGAGFTLVEVMVALAIVAIALLAALRAAGLGTNSLAEMRSRVLAGWVADNVLAEHRARADWLPLGIQRGSQYQSGIEFRWREEITSMPSPAIRRVDVYVFSASDETHSLARLSGFIAQPAGPRR
jgi:general secretion pathway protein I